MRMRSSRYRNPTDLSHRPSFCATMSGGATMSRGGHRLKALTPAAALPYTRETSSKMRGPAEGGLLEPVEPGRGRALVASIEETMVRVTEEEALRFHSSGRPGKLEISATKAL